MTAHKYSLYVGKTVQIQCNKKDCIGNNSYTGVCTGVGWSFDNDPEIDSIYLRLSDSGVLWEIFEDEIVDIKILG